MIGGILLLAIAVFGLQILFGRGEPANYVKFLVWLIFAPIIAAIGYSHVLWAWNDLPLGVQVATLAVLPFVVLVILRIAFPRAAFLVRLRTWLFEALIMILTFPFRLVIRAGRLVLQRERRRVPLDRHRPAVGGRPPVRIQPRERRPIDW